MTVEIVEKTTDQRTDETRAFLKKLDEVVHNWGKFDFNNTGSGVELKQVFRNIERARRRFNSKRFFIVVFGPLKAGKSTLTNALANAYVSPTGFGKETTRRPSLIMRGDKEKIEQFFSKNPDIGTALIQWRSINDDMEKRYPMNEKTEVIDQAFSKNPDIGGALIQNVDKKKQYQMNEKIKDSVHESFELVNDYLRKVREEKEIEDKISIKEKPFEKQELEKVLTGDLQREPLFTVIQCKGSKLLDNDVVIVDMPGLDGSRSNWREDPIHEWVIKQADYFLFCQSSVAAINIETKDFMKVVANQSQKPPIFLIQNIFEARTWQPKEKQQDDENKQRDEGVKRLKNMLGETPTARGINLGKAWDGKIENKTWLDETEFEDFEDQLIRQLQDERTGIQERNYLNNVHNKIRDAEIKLKKLNNDIEEDLKKIDDTRAKLNKATKSIEHMHYETIKENIIEQMKQVFNTPKYEESWKNMVDVEIVSFKQVHDREQTGKEVNQAIENISKKLILAVKEKIGKDLRSKYEELLTKLDELENRAIGEFQNDLLESLDSHDENNSNAAGENKQRIILKNEYPMTNDDLPSFIDSAFESEKVKEKKWLGLKSKKYNGQEIKDTIDIEGIQWKGKIKERIQIWVDQLNTNYYLSYCEKRRKNILDQIERLKNNFEDRVKHRVASANNAKYIIGGMNNSIRELKTPLENAIISNKI